MFYWLKRSNAPVVSSSSFFEFVFEFLSYVLLFSSSASSGRFNKSLVDGALSSDGFGRRSSPRFFVNLLIHINQSYYSSEEKALK